MEKTLTSVTTFAAAVMVIYTSITHRLPQQISRINTIHSRDPRRYTTCGKTRQHTHHLTSPSPHIREQYKPHYHLPQLLGLHIFYVTPISYSHTSERPKNTVTSSPVPATYTPPYHSVYLPQKKFRRTKVSPTHELKSPSLNHHPIPRLLPQRS